MGEVVYILCAVMSIGCFIMLWRGYKQTGSQLLLWSCFAFLGLALNNANLFVDMLIFPQTDINGTFWRNFLGAISGSLLLFGLIWELT